MTVAPYRKKSRKKSNKKKSRSAKKKKVSKKVLHGENSPKSRGTLEKIADGLTDFFSKLSKVLWWLNFESFLFLVERDFFLLDFFRDFLRDFLRDFFVYGAGVISVVSFETGSTYN